MENVKKISKNLIFFFLGIFLVILTSATTVSVMTVKPAIPKYFIVKTIKGDYSSEEMTDFTTNKMKNGWILKSIVAMGRANSTYEKWVVVMEKY